MLSIYYMYCHKDGITVIRELLAVKHGDLELDLCSFVCFCYTPERLIEVYSRQGAIQIHVYLYLYLTISRQKNSGLFWEGGIATFSPDPIHPF